uniref:Uncharacterized protein n=1 Tax=Micrurus paraensis TaxID=1970185 RepID=A0A2D4KJF7_9SAUR
MIINLSKSSGSLPDHPFKQIRDWLGGFFFSCLQEMKDGLAYGFISLRMLNRSKRKKEGKFCCEAPNPISMLLGLQLLPESVVAPVLAVFVTRMSEALINMQASVVRKPFEDGGGRRALLKQPRAGVFAGHSQTDAMLQQETLACIIILLCAFDAS